MIIDDNQLELIADCGEIALDTLLEEVIAVPVEDDRAQSGSHSMSFGRL